MNKAERVKKRNDSWGFFPEGRSGEQKCFECGELTTGRHHVVPVFLGGSKVIPLCESCHNMVHGYKVSQSAIIREGIKKARQKGVKLGAPRKITDNLVKKSVYLKKHGHTHQSIAEKLGVSVGTVFNAINGSKNIGTK